MSWDGPGDPAAGAPAVHPVLSRGLDLDGDGVQELVEIYTRTPENGPVRAYLVVWPGWGPAGPRSALLGENLQVVDLQLYPRRIRVRFLQVGRLDPTWGPTEWVTSVWAYGGGEPRLLDAVLHGPLAPDHLSGTRWRWVGDGVRSLEVTGATLEFRGGVVAGSTGCGPWEGRIFTSGFPGELSVAARPLPSGRCGEVARRREEAFLYRLGATDRITFEMGRLVLYDSRNPRTRAVFEPVWPRRPPFIR